MAGAGLPNGRIDAEHPAVVEWARARGIDPARLLDRGRAPSGIVQSGDGRSAEQGSTPEGPPQDVPRDPEALLGLTFKEIVDMWGGVISLSDWLDARKRTAEIRRLELQNAETDGRLIERELVRVRVFGLVDATFRRLLGHAPKTIARRVYTLAKAGAPVEEAEAFVRETISSQLRILKAGAIARAIGREEETHHEPSAHR